jgi:hypothetical protein
MRKPREPLVAGLFYIYMQIQGVVTVSMVSMVGNHVQIPLVQAVARVTPHNVIVGIACLHLYS